MSAGTAVVVIEAMKMVHEVISEHHATDTAERVAVGETVAERQPLVVLTPGGRPTVSTHPNRRRPRDRVTMCKRSTIAVLADGVRRPATAPVPEELIERTPADGLVGGVGTIAGEPCEAMSYDYTDVRACQSFAQLSGLLRWSGSPLATAPPAMPPCSAAAPWRSPPRTRASGRAARR